MPIRAGPRRRTGSPSIHSEPQFDPDASAARVPGEIRWRYSVPEIWADGVVHALGLAFAVVGAAVLCVVLLQASGGRLPAVGVYLATLILSLAVSAAYNLWPVSRAKWILRRLDHAAIFLLIAGTYTPFMALLGEWTVLAAIWAVAVFGIALKVLLPGRFDRLTIALYLALGWSGAALAPDLVPIASPSVLWLIAIGGLLYSFGVVFHVWDRLRFHNAIWHGFVLAAAAVHYAAVWTATSAVP